MHLHKCGIREFIDKTRDMQIVCFGASPRISEMCLYYHVYKPWRNIVAVVDNDEKKHGTKFRMDWKKFDIISIEQLTEIYKVNKKIAILIMLDHIACIEVIKQLDSFAELENIECYIYAMFPFCETLPIPDSILNLKSTVPQIPKILHCVWIGGKPIPDANKKWMESWHKFCPDYKIKLWDENNYDIQKNKYAYQAYNAGKFGFSSDYIRLDVMYEHGGIYLDLDVELLKNLDELLYYKAYFGLAQHYCINTGHGFGSIPQNNLIKEMRDLYDDVEFVFDDGTYNTISCDYYQTKVLKWNGFTGGNNFHVIRDAIIFPTEYLCPSNTGFGTIQITKNCYSIHHFDMSTFDNDALSERIKKRTYMVNYLKTAHN
jgi:hypothetical protein